MMEMGPGVKNGPNWARLDHDDHNLGSHYWRLNPSYGDEHLSHDVESCGEGRGNVEG